MKKLVSVLAAAACAAAMGVSAASASDDVLGESNPDVRFNVPLKDPTRSGPTPSKVEGCHGHVDKPTFEDDIRSLYVQGYVECTQPDDIDVLTRPQIYKKVSGVWKWVNASSVYFYAHRIDWKVWSMGAIDCQTQTYRHWRAISYGHVHGVATPTATSVDITINC